MFQKKDLVFSSSLGVCVVQKVVKLTTEKNSTDGVPYYVMRALTGEGKTSYIPVEHHQVALRPVLSAEEAVKKVLTAGVLTVQEIEEITYVLSRQEKQL